MVSKMINKTVAAYTLGCKVNKCDTDALLAKLTGTGFIAQHLDNAPDIIIINTCTVTHAGDKKSMQAIRRFRRQNPSAFIAVCGCMPRSQADSIEKITAAGADFVFDARMPEDLLAKLSTTLPLLTTTTDFSTAADILNERTRAFIKIQDGCDRYCAYCIVPHVRGSVESRNPADIVAEAKAHFTRGVQEIVLTGIQVAAYGNITHSGCITLPGLIEMLSSLPTRLRLSSIDPWAIDGAFLNVVAATPALCSHFHLSLQSGCDKTLARMNRRYTIADYANAAEKLKSIRPNLSLTTDIIVGFPGESNKDFEESLRFAEEMGFAQIHVFEYSPREGTPAASFPEQITSQIKTSRGGEMRALAQTLKERFFHSQIGKTTSVLFETKVKGTIEETWQGHTDNYCMVQVKGTNLANTICSVLITGISANGLIGTLA